MKGFLIFKHALFMVFRNWKEALMIFLLPLVVALGAFFLIFGLSGVNLMTGMPIDGSAFHEGVGRLIGKTIFLAVIGAICFLWSAVNWHRFVLLEEIPTHWIPDFKIGRVAAYLGQATLLFFMFLFISFVMAFILAFISSVLVSAAGMGALYPLIGIGLLCNLVVGMFFYRVAAVLPAAAVGEELSIGEAMEATDDANFAAFSLVLITFAANYGIQFLAGVLLGFSHGIAFGVTMSLSLVLGLANISILTTFYGHYVEGREIKGTVR